MNEFEILRELPPTVISGPEKAILRTIHDHAHNSGACWCAIETIATESCFSEQTVRRSIRRLASCGFMSIEIRSGATSVIKLDWKKMTAATHAKGYQSGRGTRVEGVPEWKGRGTRVEGEGYQSGTRTLKNTKGTLKESHAQKAEFEHFWKAYPARVQGSGKKTKGCKGDAESQWRKLSAQERTLAIEGVSALSASGQKPKDCHRYLQKKSWEDWQEDAQVELASDMPHVGSIEELDLWEGQQA